MFRSLAAALFASVAFSLAAPAADKDESYFPLGKGLTWKYSLTVKTNGVATKPVVQTLAGGDETKLSDKPVWSIGNDLYARLDDGIYLVGHLADSKPQPLDEPCKLLPLDIKTGDWWKTTANGESTIHTCLGTRSVKTAAGTFETQGIFSSTGEGKSQRQAYRFYARGVGLVRELITEESVGADGAAVKVETSRDLVAFSNEDAEKPIAVKAARPIRAEQVRGVLLDPANQPIAQAVLTLKRTDQPETIALQTDISGHFARNNLDPAGVYVLSVAVTTYQPQTLELVSADGSAVTLTIRLKAPPPTTLPAQSEIRDQRSESRGQDVAFPLLHSAFCILHFVTPSPVHPFTPSTSPVFLLAASAPSDPADALIDAGKQLAREGQHEAALAKYREALKLRPADAKAHGYMAASLIALRKLDEAQGQLDEGLKIDDKAFYLHELAGQVQIARGKIEDGRALYDKAAKLSPRDAGDVYADLAAVLAALKDPRLDSLVEAALKSAAAADPPNLDALFNLGQSYTAAGRQEARGYLQRYLDESRKLPEARQDQRKMQLAKQMIRALDAVRAIQ